MMRTVSRAMVILGLLIGSGISAMADDITWTLSDVVFDNGNVATGFFTTNSSITAIDSFSITISGPATGADFTAAIMVDSYLPGVIGIANSDFSKYVDLYLLSPLTSAGGVIPITSGFDCPGCGTLLINSDHHPSVGAATVPEPSAILLLGSGVGLLGTTLRRKLFHAS